MNNGIHPIAMLLAMLAAQPQGNGVHIEFLDGGSEQYDPRVVAAWQNAKAEELELTDKWRVIHSTMSDAQALLERTAYNGAHCILLTADTLDERLPETKFVLAFPDAVTRDVQFFNFTPQLVHEAIGQYLGLLESNDLAELLRSPR